MLIGWISFVVASLEEDNGEDEKDDAGEVMGSYIGWEPWFDSKKKMIKIPK